MKHAIFFSIFLASASGNASQCNTHCEGPDLIKECSVCYPKTGDCRNSRQVTPNAPTCSSSVALEADVQPNTNQYQCVAYGRFDGGNNPHHQHDEKYTAISSTENEASTQALNTCHQYSNDCRPGYCEEVVPIPYPDQSQLGPQTDVFCYGKGAIGMEILRGNNIYDAIAVISKNGKQLEVVPVKATVPDNATRPVFYQYGNGFDDFELNVGPQGQNFFFRMGQEADSGEVHCIFRPASTSNGGGSGRGGGCRHMCQEIL